MAQRRSLSGRSPFNQQKLSEELKSVSLKATTLTTNRKRKTPTTMQFPESARTGRCSLFLGRLDQGLVGNTESAHVNCPKGKAMLVPQVGRCCKALKSNNEKLVLCDKGAQPVGLGVKVGSSRCRSP